MAGFRVHIGTSTAVGVVYGVAGRYFGLPLPSCVLGGALCSVSGMLPDVDSDSGVPLRESLSFASAVAPMLALHHFIRLGWSPETIALAGAGIYAVIRFGLGKLLKWYTVHRGMFHSIPAAIIAGEAAFLLCMSQTLDVRLYKAGSVFIGYMTHLILDEFWSVEWKGGRWQVKKSFGTALKIWGSDPLANLSTFAKLGILSFFVWHEPTGGVPIRDLLRGGGLASPQPSAPADPWAATPQPAWPPSYAAPQYTQPQYTQPQYTQPQYGQPQYGQPQYGQPQYGQPQYTQPQYTQPQYEQPQYTQPQYEQPPYGDAQSFPQRPTIRR